MEQSQQLQALTSLLGQVPIVVTPHKSLNSGRGVIRCWTLEGMSNDDICLELHSQGVVEVKRLTKTEATSRSPPAYLLAFSTVSIPESVTILYQRFPVHTSHHLSAVIIASLMAIELLVSELLYALNALNQSLNSTLVKIAQMQLNVPVVVV